MTPRSLLGNEAFRRVLRSQVAHLDSDRGVMFFKSFDEILGDLPPPGMDEIEFSFFARALFKALRTLRLRELGKVLVDLLRARKRTTPSDQKNGREQDSGYRRKKSLADSHVQTPCSTKHHLDATASPLSSLPRDGEM